MSRQARLTVCSPYSSQMRLARMMDSTEGTSGEPVPGERVESDKAFSFSTSSIITIKVGPEEESFAIHEDLICHRSEYFRRAMKPYWTEAADRTIKLNGVKPTTFSTYMNLVYTNRLPIKTLCDHDIEDREKVVKCIDAEYIALANLYVFAERIQDIQAKNSTVLAFVKLAHSKIGQRRHYVMPGPKIVAMVYEGTMEGDKMRKLLVDLWSFWSVRQLKKEDRLDQCPREFERDLLYAHIVQVERDIKEVRDLDGRDYLQGPTEVSAEDK